MMRTDVDLCFKGDRTYLHGTDVYGAAVATLRGQWPQLDGRCRFTFHRLTRKPLTAWVQNFSAAGARPDGCVAEMHVTGGATEASVWFTERDGEVAGRYPYDEDAVVRECRVEGDRISMKQAPDNAVIEIVVAMTKRLHYAVLTPERGRWLFTRLDLSRLLRDDDRHGMSITMTSAPRTALTRSEIAVGHRRIGSIFFSVGAA
jgi:hypothetical protein